eukprot:CAMPEP_0198235184 /NCGR_PEP_ID=MMETSP1446-20131203/1096_1 /TAXON_ID=1461542 ORGANISM="Unidentified sp, Strain CCMP2111" /NCGR_SAMPLE_ID=MMETSP1446 /ASSEMBLY_ACC=CAM_ASM_001112 /LENGTH=591 /DNA_ID=CAMNT_0043916237 /DNA_START=362 /DNA_END=2138 /DNA_ORIENTATION=+
MAATQRAVAARVSYPVAHVDCDREGQDDAFSQWKEACLPTPQTRAAATFVAIEIPPGGGSTPALRMKGLKGLKYTVTDVPPWLETSFYCLQHLVTFMGICTLMSKIIVPNMGGTSKDIASAISTQFIFSGVSTLLQTIVGSRLPMLQGPSYSYALGVLGVLLYHKSQEVAGGPPLVYGNILPEIQGAFLVAAACQVLVGLLGCFGLLARFLSPISLSPTIIAIGIISYASALEGVIECPEIGVGQILLVIFISQYLKHFVKKSGNSRLGWLSFSDAYSILVPTILMWLISVAMTESGVFDAYRNSANGASMFCRTDGDTTVLTEAKWFYIPSFFEFGGPTFSVPSIVIILTATLTSSIESLGCFNAVARVAGAPVPERGAINRGIGMEGFGQLLSSCFGSGGFGIVRMDCTIGIIGITKVGSRRVIQVTACLMIVCGFIGKVGAICSRMPLAIICGTLCCTCGIISAVGISICQVAKLNSPRNLFILGFAIFNGFSVQRHFKISANLGEPGVIRTPSTLFNVVFHIFVFNPVVFSLVLSFLLDTTIPGKREERGIHIWRSPKLQKESTRYQDVYHLPWGIGRKYFAWAFWL